MPRRSQHILVGTTTIAFCASLMLHAFVVVTAVDQYASGRIYLPGFDRSQVSASKPDRLLIPLPIPEPKLDAHQLGKSDGIGTAIDDSPGESPLIARKGAQDQALLSRDPAGPARRHSEPSDSVLPTGSAGRQPPPAGVQQARAPQEAIEASIETQRSIPFGVGELEPRATDSEADRPARTARSAVARSAVESASADAQPSMAQAVGQPGAPKLPADAAPQAETESDPFTVVGGAQFRPGGTKAQLGRAHKLVAPRIGLSGLVDGVQIGRVQVVLQVKIDSTGNVTSANIFKSSGSDSIDQACRVAAYQWWFEPLKAKDGRVRREETFLFVITFS